MSGQMNGVGPNNGGHDEINFVAYDTDFES